MCGEGATTGERREVRKQGNAKDSQKRLRDVSVYIRVVLRVARDAVVVAAAIASWGGSCDHGMFVLLGLLFFTHCPVSLLGCSALLFSVFRFAPFCFLSFRSLSFLYILLSSPLFSFSFSFSSSFSFSFSFLPFILCDPRGRVRAVDLRAPRGGGASDARRRLSLCRQTGRLVRGRGDRRPLAPHRRTGAPTLHF